jgi:hypothetical protein
MADGDIVLVGLADTKRPQLHLDDLLVFWRAIHGDFQAPFCSLDPEPESVQAVRAVEAEGAVIHSADDFRRFGERIEKAWNIKGQKVIVGGVPRSSRVGHVLIDADYLMKAHSSGKQALVGVASLIERSLNAANKSGATAGMARFWFHYDNQPGQPMFVTDEGVVAIAQLDVKISTRRQNSSRDGRLGDADASQGDDPQMLAMGRDLSQYLAKHPAQPALYAELDNQFRLYALLRALHERGADRQLKLGALSLQNELEARPMPDSLPGQVAYEVVSKVSQQGNRRTTSIEFPLVMGGVDMGLRLTGSSFRKASGRAAAAIPSDLIRQFAIHNDGRSVYWRSGF